MIQKLDSYKRLARKRRAKLDAKHQIESAKAMVYETLGFALMGLMVLIVLLVHAWLG